MSNEPTVVYSARMPAQAMLVRNLLAQNGIEAYVVNEALQGVRGAVGLSENTEAKVVVAAPFAEAARRLADEFERLDAQGHGQFELENGKAPSPPTREELFPPCPACGAARAMICPYCETRGTEFRLGESAGDGPLVVCPTCDEPFEPRYLRYCTSCQHDFGAGFVDEAGEALTPRMVAVMLGLAGVFVLLLGYFFWLFNRV